GTPGRVCARVARCAPSTLLTATAAVAILRNSRRVLAMGGLLGFLESGNENETLHQPAGGPVHGDRLGHGGTVGSGGDSRADRQDPGRVTEPARAARAGGRG